MDRIARLITKRAKSCGCSATVISPHCCLSADAVAGAPATTWAREGSCRNIFRCWRGLGRYGSAPRIVASFDAVERRGGDFHNTRTGMTKRSFPTCSREASWAKCGRRGVLVRNLQQLDADLGVLPTALCQPLIEQFSFHQRGRRGEHQRVSGERDVSQVGQWPAFAGRARLGSAVVAGAVGMSDVAARLLVYTGVCLRHS